MQLSCRTRVGRLRRSGGHERAHGSLDLASLLDTADRLRAGREAPLAATIATTPRSRAATRPRRALSAFTVRGPIYLAVTMAATA